MRTLIDVIKIFPVVMTLLMTIGIFLCLLGCDISTITYAIIGHSMVYDGLLLMIYIGCPPD